MAVDSNSPGDDRGPSGAAERLAAAGLKLVTEREGASSAAPPSGAGSSSDPASGPVAAGASVSDAKRGQAASIQPPRPLVSTGRQLPLWLFVALFVLFLLGYGYQIHHASRLELEVTRLEQELADSKSRLESHRAHLREIRSGVHDLTARLEQLRLLIDRDPTREAEKRRADGLPVIPGLPESDAR